MSAASQTIVVAMSGGVDSSVAAALLKEQGHQVIGVFMRNGIKADGDRPHRQGCCGVDDALDARRVADRLDIPFYALDMEEPFADLIRGFVQAYVSGKTPNPCIECNRRLKMGAVLQLALRLGADAVATGHYARVSVRDGRLSIRRARDVTKDQSYALFSLDQETLARVRFPLGEYTKPEVRELARLRSLPVAEKRESMEICFVTSGDYRDLVRSLRPESCVPGPIVDREGRCLGQHQGVALFTVGQRRGLPSGQPEPLYVTGIDAASATVTVGDRADLLVSEFEVEDVVFSGRRPPSPGEEVRGEVRIRSQHPGVRAVAALAPSNRLRITLDAPEKAVTPGQAAVFYDQEYVLFGGWISSPQPPCRADRRQD